MSPYIDCAQMSEVPDLAAIKAQMLATLSVAQLSSLGPKALVRQLAESLGLERDALMPLKDQVAEMALTVIKGESAPKDFFPSLSLSLSLSLSPTR